MNEKVPATLAKIPLQETRIFYERYANYENLNNLLLTEIETARKEDKVGMPAGNAGCWRSMYKYKCETELFKAFGLLLSGWMDHYFPKEKMDALEAVGVTVVKTPADIGKAVKEVFSKI